MGDHDDDCPVARGADPDLCRCDLLGALAESWDRAATPNQTRRLQALFRRAGITDRSERLARTGALIGRRVTSASELTGRENQVVCEWLEAMT